MWSCGIVLSQVLYKPSASVHIKAPPDCFFSCFFVTAALPPSPYCDHVRHGNHKNPFMSEVLHNYCFSSVGPTQKPLEGGLCTSYLCIFVALSWRLIDIVFLALWAVRSSQKYHYIILSFYLILFIYWWRLVGASGRCLLAGSTNINVHWPTWFSCPQLESVCVSTLSLPTQYLTYC